jgi:hypothetical protein
MAMAIALKKKTPGLTGVFKDLNAGISLDGNVFKPVFQGISLFHWNWNSTDQK